MRTLLGDTYHYKRIDEFAGSDLASYKADLAQKFSKLTKAWTDELHSEWTARMYLSAKMIYSSTLLLNSAQYARFKNILITEPYLLYYSLFNCARALIFSHPIQIWHGGALISDTHKNVIRRVGEIIKSVNKTKSESIKLTIEKAKDYRELFSYRYPANGVARELPFADINIDDVSDTCSLICELAQFTSESFQNSFEKNCSSKRYNLKEEILDKCIYYSGTHYSLLDKEDGYRIGRILRKRINPTNIYLTMTEGMTEDFMGSWRRNEDCDDEHFDPDHLNIEIFDLP